MRWLSLVLLLGGCQLVFELEAPPGAQRRTITIQPPTSTPLQQFPVGIVIADGTLDQITDGDNMRFVAADGSELVSEHLFDPDAHALEAWVLIDELQGDLEISFEWGGDVAHGSDPKRVWGEGPGGESRVIASTWHLSEREPGLARDSGNDINGSVDLTERAGSPTPIAGVYGNGRRFDGDALCTITGDANFQYAATAFSWGLWVRIPAGTVSGEFDQPLSKGGETQNRPGFDFELGTDEWAANACCDGSLNRTNFTAGTAVTVVDDWVHLVATLDPLEEPFGQLRFYIDGELKETQPVEDDPNKWGTVNSDELLCIGADTTDLDLLFHGEVDEVRVYNRALPQAWIATETFNAKNRADFIELGEPVPGS